jgi:[acyl-carrier-protein] S-malonyltransferase
MSLGFVFPGQGSQAVGMLGDLAADYSQVAEHFSRAGEAIGAPLWDIVQSGPEERLNSTEITQPALLVASAALWSLWRDQGGPLPSLLAGHSLGEYSALVCGGALSLEAGARLVHQRGKLMQEAVPNGQGTMAAVLGLDDNVVQDCCEQVADVVSPANYNAPGQVVIAGTVAGVEAAVERCKQAGARRATMLTVSGPFHCQLMEPARDAFAEVLADADLRMPDIPVVHNVDGTIAEDLAQLKAKLVAQIAAPVLWTTCVQNMRDAGVSRLIECGAGKVLAGLSKRIDRSLRTDSIGTIDGLNDGLQAVLSSEA